jgi:hypothetical protein
MKHKQLNESGFIPMLIVVLIVVAVIVFVVYARVSKAHQ